MKETIFNMMYELLDLSSFELEYNNRSKSTPFSEKWKNSSLTRSRIKGLKYYLYRTIIIFLRSDKQTSFFETVLRPFVHCNYSEFVESFKNQQKFNEGSEIPLENMNILYKVIFYKLTLEELFILLTNVITWEHQSYPSLLEHAICQEHQNQTDINTSDDLLRYYVRFLDVLSSAEIISLFDLDALRNTIQMDNENIGEKSLSSLLLFRDWPLLNTQSFHNRFPEFKQNLSQKMVQASDLLSATAFDVPLN
ncbi:MAG: hypothetical protein E4G98_02010 [Promethearchaeota archaeon]|nr:MAG: hypothetical protein E4G98_02010 [Candidatus Lokiarchaeota archaeon]